MSGADAQSAISILRINDRFMKFICANTNAGHFQVHRSEPAFMQVIIDTDSDVGPLIQTGPWVLIRDAGGVSRPRRWPPCPGEPRRSAQPPRARRAVPARSFASPRGGRSG